MAMAGSDDLDFQLAYLLHIAFDHLPEGHHDLRVITLGSFQTAGFFPANIVVLADANP